MESIPVLDLRKSVIYLFQITFLILVMASLIVDRGMVGLSGTSLLFHILRDH